MQIKLASWNVNGIRAVSSKPDWRWFSKTDASIIGLQEIKASPEQLSDSLRKPKGWHAYWNPSIVRKGYSGTAVFSRIKPLVVKYDPLDPCWQGEGRLIYLEFPWFHYFTGYFPNGGGAELDVYGQPTGNFKRLGYKMGFYEAFVSYAQKLRRSKPIVVCGDFNIACQPIDLARPKDNENCTGFLPVERDFMQYFKTLGYVDTFRHIHGDEPNNYTWWSYKNKARPRNVGWRLDYFFVSNELAPGIIDASTCDDVYGSDHCPVSLTLRVNKEQKAKVA